MVKYIKVFIASSIVEFKKERQELAAFINSLNNICVKKGIYIELMLCEDLGNAVAMKRKQDEYNEFIRSCQYFYILFGKKAGGYTVEEFDVALKQFQDSGAPKIHTYFKQLPDGETAEQSIMDFRNRLDKQLDHHYSWFTRLITIKLNMLLELSRDPLVCCVVECKDGKVYLDSKPILSLDEEDYEEAKNILLQKQTIED